MYPPQQDCNFYTGVFPPLTIAAAQGSSPDMVELLILGKADLHHQVYLNLNLNLNLNLYTYIYILVYIRKYIHTYTIYMQIYTGVTAQGVVGQALHYHF